VDETKADFLNLPLLVKSEDGQAYVIDAFQATLESIEFLWSVVSKFDFIASRLEGDRERFQRFLMRMDTFVFVVWPEDRADARNIGDAVGVLYAGGFVPKLELDVHFIFWDRQQKGRHRVLGVWLRWLMDSFDVHRVSIEVPVYAYAALRRLQNLGVRLEGRKREADQYRGEWRDTLIFSVLQHELTEEAIEAGKLRRSNLEDRWFGLLDKSDEPFMQAVLKKLEV